MKKPVSWVIFTFVIGLIFIVIGYLFSCISKAEGRAEEAKETVIQISDDYKTDVLEIKTQLSGIQADLIWLKKNFR